MENAIKKAIEGGYKESEIKQCTIYFIHEGSGSGKKDCLCVDNSYTDEYDKRHNLAEHYCKEQMLLDPLFWIALGKAEGWDGSTWTSQYQDGWLYHWHRFIDHIAEDKDIDSFFEELLPTKQ